MAKQAVDEDLTKAKIRRLHSGQRREVLRRNRRLVEDRGPELVKHFATGNQVVPDKISPELVEVAPGSLESELFRFASLLWSIPVSQGFGRRLRFLVRDRHNGCLMGLFALGDPVFNLAARDRWIGWTHNDRRGRLVHVMDGYVVGAVPPYSQLIGGKLVAALMGSEEVNKAHERKYLESRGVISKKKHRARLLLLTTTSALGRSSLYNRLRIPNGPRFLKVGETKGFGHFQLGRELFASLREYLKALGHPVADGHRFGMGPNWKFRVVRTALEELGIPGNSVLKHGIHREVYVIPLAENREALQESIMGRQADPKPSVRPAAEISDYCLWRWIRPRALRDKRYKRAARCRIIPSMLSADAVPCG